MSKPTKPVQLGCIAKCLVTAFEGVVIADTLHLNGCRRFYIQSQTLKDKKPVEESFDSQNVVYVKEGPIVPPYLVAHIPNQAPAGPERVDRAPVSLEDKRPGGPFPSPERTRDPK